jgi:hypothetical protein
MNFDQTWYILSPKENLELYRGDATLHVALVLFDFEIVPTMCYVLFFISFYIFYHLFISFLRLVDDMFTFPSFISRSPFVLIQAFVLIVLVVFILYLYYLLFCSFNVSTLNLYKIPTPKLWLKSTSTSGNNESVTFLLSSSSSEN